MACGVPVIATQSGGVPEIVRHNQDGILVPPGSMEKMAAAMLTLLRDEVLRNQLGQSGSQRAESFSLKNHLRKMDALFVNMVEKGRL